MKKEKSNNSRDEKVIEFLGKKYILPELKENEIDLDSFTKLNASNYEDDLEKIPGLLNIFGVLVAKALRKKMVAETNYRVWRATKSNEVRKMFEKKGIKFTESKIEDEINSDPEFLIKKKAIYNSEETYEIIKANYWAIQKKAEILLEISKQRNTLNKLDKARLEK